MADSEAEAAVPVPPPLLGADLPSGAVLNWIAQCLADDSEDKASVRLEARLLLGLVLGRDGQVFPHEKIAVNQSVIESLTPLIARLKRGEPMSRLRGWREFYGLRFAITPATLDPRADSEVVVDTAVDWLQGQKGKKTVLDLGTGSGCLLLSVLAHCPHATGLGVDISPKAINCAKANAESLNLSDRITLAVGDWDDGIGEKFDAVLCNPPYIATPMIAGLMPSVKEYDPRLALDGGGDGLACWRRVLPSIARCLKPQGQAFVEIGQGQGDLVSTLAHQSGLQCLNATADLAGIRRSLTLAPRK